MHRTEIEAAHSFGERHRIGIDDAPLRAGAHLLQSRGFSYIRQRRWRSVANETASALVLTE